MSEANIHQEDLELARAATGGDEQAWRLIYDRTSGQLYNFLCYQTGDRDAAIVRRLDDRFHLFR